MASVSLHKQILDAVEAKLVTLLGDAGLDGFAAGRINQLWFPDPENVKKFQDTHGLPAIFVCPYGSESMPPNQGTNLSDDIGYPAPVAIVAAKDDNLANHLDKYLVWRETAMGAFHNKRLAGVEEVFQCVVSPGAIVDWTSLANHGFWVSSFQIIARARKVRPT